MVQAPNHPPSAAQKELCVRLYSPPECTPIDTRKYKTIDPGRLPSTTTQSNAEDRRTNMMRDSVNCYVRMSMPQFLSHHLGGPPEDFGGVHPGAYVRSKWWEFRRALGLSYNVKAGETDKLKEKDFSAAWEKVVNTHNLCPGFFLNLSEDKPDRQDEYAYKIDASFMAEEDRAYVTPGRPNWPLALALVEFKRLLDPFDDRPTHQPDSDAENRKKVLGQIMSYAERVFSHQHRTGVFMLLVSGPRFRVMRWDRSGVIVSESIDYVSTPSGTRELLIVLLSLSRLDRQNLGMDLTAVSLKKDSCGWKRMNTLANPCPRDLDCTERALDPRAIDPVFRPESKGKGKVSYVLGDPTVPCDHHSSAYPKIIPVYSYIREMFRNSLVEGFPRYCITVCDKQYLVGKEIVLASEMIGRGTRGYVALEWQTQRFVFLKDAWRPHYVGLKPEGHVLKCLNEAHVANVPTLVAQEDVPLQVANDATTPVFQETFASNYSPDTGPWEVEPYDPWTPDDKDRVIMNLKAKTVLPPILEEAGSQAQPGLPNQPDVSGVQKSETKKSQSARPPSLDPPLNAQQNIVGLSCPTVMGEFVPQAQMGTPQKSCGDKRSIADVEIEDQVIQGVGLRHMVHTRTVVEEVCLPFTAFTSGRQLVRVVYNSVCAHQQAYNKCKYLHRDVSSGNIIIYPVVKVVTVKGKEMTVIIWMGFLTDWEFAKHLEDRIAMQPGRTGTWHFLSRHLLDNPRKPSTVTDELEAFGHVIVYGAMRLLKSNMGNIDGFMNEYFYSYSPDGRTATFNMACPPGKRECIEAGALVYNNFDVTFSVDGSSNAASHPINELFTQFMTTLKARYALLKLQEKSSAAPQTPGRTSETLSPAAEMDTLFGTDPCEDIGSFEYDQPDVDSTKALYERQAARLKDHYWFCWLLQDLVNRRKWPSNDVVHDRQESVAQVVLPPLERHSTNADGSRPRKKPKVEPAASPENAPEVPVPDASSSTQPAPDASSLMQPEPNPPSSTQPAPDASGSTQASPNPSSSTRLTPDASALTQPAPNAFPSTQPAKVRRTRRTAHDAAPAPIAGSSTDVRLTRSKSKALLAPVATANAAASGSTLPQQESSRRVTRATSSRGGTARGQARTTRATRTTSREDAQGQGTGRGRKAGGAAARSRRR